MLPEDFFFLIDSSRTPSLLHLTLLSTHRLLFFLSDVIGRILEELRDRGQEGDVKRGSRVDKIVFFEEVSVKSGRDNS